MPKSCPVTSWQMTLNLNAFNLHLHSVVRTHPFRLQMVSSSSSDCVLSGDELWGGRIERGRKDVYIGQSLGSIDDPSVEFPLFLVSIGRYCSHSPDAAGLRPLTVMEYVPGRNFRASKSCNLLVSMYRSSIICCTGIFESVKVLFQGRCQERQMDEGGKI